MEDRMEHGFDSKEAWYEAFDIYSKKIREINAAAHRLLNTEQCCEEWISDFKHQSDIIRSMYLKNDQFKQQHIYYFVKDPHHWNDKIADSLLAYLYRYWGRMEDVEALYAVALSLYEYYEKQQQEIAMMKCLLVITYCYCFLDDVHYYDLCIRLCKQFRKLFIKHYAQLDEEERSMGVSIYDFEASLRYSNLHIDDNFQTFFDEELYPEYKEAEYMMYRFMQEADMQLPLNQILPYMYVNLKRRFTEIALRIHKDTLRKDQLQMLQEMADELLHETEFVDNNGQVEHVIVYYMSHRFEMQYTPKQLVEIFMDAIRQLEASTKVESQLDIKQLMETMEAFSRSLTTLGEECFDCVQVSMPCWSKYLEYLLKIHYNQGMAQQIDQTLYHYMIPMLQYIDDENEVFKKLLDITVFRQIQTAIHSLMVGKCACAILEHIIEKQPQLLYETLHVNTPQEVIAVKKLLLNYIMRAAWVHDVGKMLCTQVINMQYRRLIDVEFETIKFHPVSSGEILSSIPLLKKYHDIAVGHHKSYDGSFGYPKDFDNIASPQRFFIDLIRICDSLDAATDTFGRLYAAAKTFDCVLQEFEQLKKTSYNNQIIDFIQENHTLQDELRCLVEEKREQVYIEIYDLIKNKQYRFMEA